MPQNGANWGAANSAPVVQRQASYSELDSSEGTKNESSGKIAAIRSTLDDKLDSMTYGCVV